LKNIKKGSYCDFPRSEEIVMPVKITPELIQINKTIAEVFGEGLHKKRQLSLGNAALGLLRSGSLFVHEMGAALAFGNGKSKKHATKQIDRLFSNAGIDIWELSASWVPYIIGHQKQVYVALDWSSFADDEQTTLCLNVLTSQGRSTPLLWKTVAKSLLKYNRARYEDQMLSRLKEVIPNDVQVVVVADRGFADQKFFKFIAEELKFSYIIRIKSSTIITDKHAESRKAQDWLREDGRAIALEEALITQSHYAVKKVVIVKDKAMKAGWFLVSNTDMKTREIINMYGKRWKIEPYFRDLKDEHFGFGLYKTHIKSAERRDRLLLVVALSYLLLTLLGQAGEQIGFDQKLKVNTVKTRTHSLFRQGQFYYQWFERFSSEEQRLLLYEFNKVLQQHDFWNNFFGDLK
jgi:transposase